MIKINLAKRKNTATATMDGGTKMNLDRLGLNWDNLKELPLKTILLCLVVSYFATSFAEDFKKEKLDAKDREIKVVLDKEEKVNRELAKVKEYEKTRKDLESDAANLRRKIEAIQKLISDRLSLYNTMTALSGAMPAGVWLRDFTITGDSITFTGSSLDLSQVSDFMKRLGESPQFQKVELRSSNQAKDVGGGDIVNFDLAAKRR